MKECRQSRRSGMNRDAVESDDVLPTAQFQPGNSETPSISAAADKGLEPKNIAEQDNKMVFSLRWCIWCTSSSAILISASICTETWLHEYPAEIEVWGHTCLQGVLLYENKTCGGVRCLWGDIYTWETWREEESQNSSAQVSRLKKLAKFTLKKWSHWYNTSSFPSICCMSFWSSSLLSFRLLSIFFMMVLLVIGVSLLPQWCEEIKKCSSQTTGGSL